MRKIELVGNDQKQLEMVVHNKIHQINAALRKALKQYEDWNNVDDKTKDVYKTKEQFKERVIDRWKEDRTYYVKKLDRIRQGYIIE